MTKHSVECGENFDNIQKNLIKRKRIKKKT